MEIGFRTHILEKMFLKHGELDKRYGARMAKIISVRLALLFEVDNLSEVPSHPPD